ncbi:MAG: PLD nuclease N-terminal domain-containing protein [Chloroflexota bacterium]
MSDAQILMALLPLVFASLGLMFLSLRDLIARPVKEVTGGNKAPWLLIILLVSTFGSVAYLLFGRRGQGPRNP